MSEMHCPITGRKCEYSGCFDNRCSLQYEAPPVAVAIPAEKEGGGDVKCFADRTSHPSTFIRIVDGVNEYKAEVFDEVVAFHIYKNGEKKLATYAELTSPTTEPVEEKEDVEEAAKKYATCVVKGPTPWNQFDPVKYKAFLAGSQRQQGTEGWISVEEVERMIRAAITESILGMQEWIEKGTVIKDKQGNILPDAEIDLAENALPGTEYIYPRLVKHGIKFTP